MAEREKYEKWIRDLDAKRDATPPHVFERVHGDYTKRLDEVREQLSRHAADMQQHATSLVARLRGLEETERRLLDEQSEVELRSHVGEMTKNDFDAANRRADRELTRVQQDQEKIAHDLNEIRRILEGPGSDDGASADAEEEPRHASDFDELAFLKSVVGTPPQPAPASSAPASAAPTPAPATAAPPSAPPVAAPASVLDASGTPAVSQKAITPPIGTPAVKRDTPPGANAPATPPSARTSGVVEQPKTLKCSECGAMNYPSEWYCERCGAELTAM